MSIAGLSTMQEGKFTVLFLDVVCAGKELRELLAGDKTSGT